MKKIFIVLILFALCPSLRAEVFTLNIPDEWRANIEDSIYDMDDWAYTMLEMKSANGKSRIVQKELALSIEANEVLPAGEDAIVQKHLNRPDYKNKKQKDDELKNK